MAENHGFQTIMAVGLESTWGTGVNATQKLPYISDSLDALRRHNQTPAMTGSATMPKSTQGVRVAGGGIETYYTYGLIQPLLQAFFGDHTVDAADDFYTYTDLSTGISLTVAVNRGVSIHEYLGYKIGELTLSGAPNDAVKLSLSGNAKNRLVSGTENTSGELEALAEPAEQVLFHELTFRIGDLADDLAAGDNVSISNFSLKMNRNHVVKEVNSTTAEQAKENGFAQGELEFTLPYYDADTWITRQEAHTLLQASLIFTDGTNTHYWNMPQALVVEAPVPQSDAGMTEPKIKLSLHPNRDAANANTAMTHEEFIRLFEA
jgi:Phage tail tube protein